MRKSREKIWENFAPIGDFISLEDEANKVDVLFKSGRKRI